MDLSTLSENLKERTGDDLFRLIATYSYDWESLHAPDGHVLWINPAVLRQTGYSAAECLADPAFPGSVIHADDRRRFVDRLANALKTRTEAHDVKFRVVRRDGSTFWGAACWQPVYSSASDYLGIRMSVRDISDRKRTESLLEIQRDMALTLNAVSCVETSVDYIIDTLRTFEGIDCGAMYLVNETNSALRMVCHRGLSQRFVAAKRTFTTGSREWRTATTGRALYYDQHSLQGWADPLIKAERLTALAVMPVFHQDRLIAVFNIASRTSNEIAHDARHALEAIASQIGGIIDRVRIAQALRESEGLYRTAVSALGDGILLHDRAGAIISGNASAWRHLGVTVSLPAALDAVFGSDRFVDEAGNRLTLNELPVRQTLSTGEPVTGMVIGVQDVNGQMRWLTLNSHPLYREEPGGGLYGAVMSILDITEHRRNEEMTRKIEQVETIGLLAGNVAYNFSSIAGAIRHRAHSVMNSQLPTSAVYDDCQRIAEAAEHALQLTRRLTRVARASDCQEPKRDRVFLPPLIRHALKLMHRGINEQSIVVKTGRLDRAPMVEVDAAWLTDVLLNVLANAVDAMPSGGTLRISVSRKKSFVNHGGWAGGMPSYAVIHVADDGDGMNAQTLAHAFDPFFTTKKGEVPSLGLGLTVARSLAESWGGKLDLRSRPGRGTLVRIYVPQAADVLTTSPLAGTGAPVFILEDDEMFAARCRDVLEECGFSVQVLASAAAARLHLSSIQIPAGVLIVDYLLEDGPADDFLQWIQQTAPHLPVILTSGFSRDFLRGKVLLSGWRYLQKPFETDLLVHAVECALNNSR